MANYMLPEVMANFFLKATLFFGKMSQKYQVTVHPDIAHDVILSESEESLSPETPRPAQGDSPSERLQYQNEQQKYCVAACIFFCVASIEAYLNFLADDFIKKNGTQIIKK